MSIIIHPEFEAKLRAQAEAEGLTVEAYLERLVHADQRAQEGLESLALEELESNEAAGEPLEVGPGYWEEKLRRLDEQLKKTLAR